jgi:hypothetical protein
MHADRASFTILARSWLVDSCAGIDMLVSLQSTDTLPLTHLPSSHVSQLLLKRAHCSFGVCECARTAANLPPGCVTLAAMERVTEVTERFLAGDGGAKSGESITDSSGCSAAAATALVTCDSGAGSGFSKGCADMTLADLPAELVVWIAAWLIRLEDRVRFAATCRAFHAAVYNAPELWREIKFSQSSGARMTDVMLDALLTRCSACTRTKKLSLFYCTRVNGSGLAPLKGSSVLLNVELITDEEQYRTHGLSGFDNELVAGILHSSVEGCAKTEVVQTQHCCRD